MVMYIIMCMHVFENIIDGAWCVVCYGFYFFFNDTATTEIYTLSLHDALPIYPYPRLIYCSTCATLVQHGSYCWFSERAELTLLLYWKWWCCCIGSGGAAVL